MTREDVIASGVHVSGVLANVKNWTALTGTTPYTNYALYLVAVDGQNVKSELYEAFFTEQMSIDQE